MKTQTENTVKCSPTKSGNRKVIRYATTDHSRYAVIEYTRPGERSPFRRVIVHGA
jgi:hypothetical protein